MHPKLKKIGLDLLLPVAWLFAIIIIFIVSVIIFSYILIIAAIIVFILFIIGFIRVKLMKRKLAQTFREQHKIGRTIDHE